MSVNKFLRSALKSTMPTLSGGEAIGLGGKSVPVIGAPEFLEEDLVLGGDADHRTCRVMVASADLKERPKEGEGVEFREEDWKVEGVEYHPETSTVITLRGNARRGVR